MSGNKRALLISEAGWRGMKEYSSALLGKGVHVDIVIKGKMEKEVLSIITRPAGLKICAVPKWLFMPYIFFYLLWHRVGSALKFVVVSKETTRSWVKGLGFDAKLLVETKEGYDLK